MAKFDLVLICFVFLSSLIGLLRGITKEILSLLSWIGAVALSYVLFPMVQHITRGQITNPMLADGVTVIAIFLLFLITLSLISHMLSMRIRQSALSGVDRSLGFAYGIVRAFAVLFIFEIAFSCFWLRPDHPALIKEGRFIDFIYKGSDTLYGMLPLSTQMWVRETQQKRLEEKRPLKPDTILQAAEVVEKIVPIVQADMETKKEQPKAEDLANLKPREATEVKETRKVNSKKQDLELERLLDQADSE